MSINLAKGNAISTYSWADGVVKLRKPVSQGAEKRFLGAISVGEAPPQPHKLIYARVEKDKVVRY